MVRSVLLISKRKNNDNPSQEQLIDEINSSLVISNKEHGITGILAVGGTHFLNILEGSDSKISDLIAQIKTDQADNELILIFDSYYEDRIFSDWRLIEEHCHETSIRFNQLLMRNADALVLIDDDKFNEIEKIVEEVLH